MDEQTLEPCPFCGSAENLFIEPDETGSGGQWVPPIHVGCDQQRGCGISVARETEAEAIAAWNRRAAHSVIAGKVAELEGALGELVRRFDRRDWVLSGDDSKALFHARAALAPHPERRSEHHE